MSHEARGGQPLFRAGRSLFERASRSPRYRRRSFRKGFTMKTSFLPRALIVGSLIGAAVATGSLAPAMAQSTTSHGSTTKPPAAAAATSSKPETVEQRITELKTALKITPDQDTKWKAVADAMRQNAGMMDKVIQDKQKATNMTAVQDLKTYQEISQTHLDGLKNVTSAFESLYDSMPDPQKKNADQVFMNFGGPSNQAKAGARG
jgi:hypothetical protein